MNEKVQKRKLGKLSKAGIIGGIVALCLALGAAYFFAFGSIRGDGKVVTQERKVEVFSAIELSGDYTANIHFGKSNGVSVTTDGNLQKHIKVEVSDSVLSISFIDTNFKPIMSTKLVVDITMPEISSLDISGAANVTFDEGSALELKLAASGSCSIDAQKYQVKNVIVNFSGSANAKIWVTEALSGDASGAGSIHYKGDPKSVDVDTSGVFSVNQL
ncbi:MAG: DUF2807 domain-containing protein [Candidatus Nomurabacteria bacterium]|jgi:hypothetical protein|nr:DUF2807 domain-containing protein [Candidatus Nomurabacteria bacterium]